MKYMDKVLPPASPKYREAYVSPGIDIHHASIGVYMDPEEGQGLTDFVGEFSPKEG